MARTKHGKSWIQRHVQDPYVKQAQVAGFRSRASFKLLELQQKDKLFRPGMVVVDLGASPGGWSQVVRQFVGAKGCVIALDKLEMDPLAGVHFIQGDFEESATALQVSQILDNKKVDWVVSDMAPNMSGLIDVDQPRMMCLAELAWEFAHGHLIRGGGMVVKVFQGEGFEPFIRTLRQAFDRVVIRKPAASRSASRELYIVARGYYIK